MDFVGTRNNNRCAHFHRIEVDSVGAVGIYQDEFATAKTNSSMLLRNVVIGQYDVIVGSSPNGYLVFFEDHGVAFAPWLKNCDYKHGMGYRTGSLPLPSSSKPMSLPILYSFRRCPYAMRARLALQEVKAVCELREIVLRDKPESMLAISSKGTVPVLLCPDGKVVDESLDIMLWAFKQVDSHLWLRPSLGSLSETLVLVERTEREFKGHLDKYKYAGKGKEDEALQHRGLASTFLMELESDLTKAPWLRGERKSLADVAIAPFVRQFANVDRGWFDSQPWPKLRNWLDVFLSSPEFASVMEKYKPWQLGDEPVLFPQ